MNYIKLRKNTLCVEKISALNFTKKNKTPFYCYSLSQLKSNFYEFSNAFLKIKPLICFSVKSNSNLTLLKELKKIGSGADVVSAGELLKTLKAGFKVKKIVFSGVGKTYEEIEIAIKKGVLLINIESESEANLIDKISRKMSKRVSVGIRLNPNVTGKTNKKISTGGKDDKFGLNYKDCLILCKKVNKMKNLKLEGISVHIGSQINSLKPFALMLKVINKVINKTKINFKFIDLGGGVGIPYFGDKKKLV
jgi:diaminopimelate decarboxylase